MKKLLSASIAAATMTAFVAPAQAEIEGLSANVGAVSDYYFRGASLGDAAAYAGADYEIAGFYVGTWIIDDGATSVDDSSGQESYGNDGLETDFYLGYGMALENGFSFAVGATTYQYTYTSDDETEFGGSVGFAGFGLEAWLGTDTDVVKGGDNVERDYTIVAVSWAGDVFGVTLGNADFDESDSGANDDNSYNWAEVSAGGEVAGLDAAVVLGTTFGAKAGGEDASSGDGYIFLDVSKSFSF